MNLVDIETPSLTLSYNGSHFTCSEHGGNITNARDHMDNYHSDVYTNLTYCMGCTGNRLQPYPRYVFCDERTLTCPTHSAT